MAEITLLFDFIAVLAYAGALAIGIRTYRETTLESGFWLNYSFAVGLGILWTGVVFLEWLGIAGAIMDAFSNSLLAILIGVVAISATGSLAVVEDLKAATGNAERRRRDAEQAREEAEDVRKEAEEARGEAEAFNDRLREKAAEYGQAMERAANGDLTVRVDPSSQSEAMAEIGETFNRMLGELEATLSRIAEFADEVAVNSEQITASSGEIKASSDQVSESVQEISAGTDEEHDRLQRVSNEMQNLSGTIEEVASSASQVASVSKQAAERGERGSEHASQAL